MRAEEHGDAVRSPQSVFNSIGGQRFGRIGGVAPRHPSARAGGNIRPIAVSGGGLLLCLDFLKGGVDTLPGMIKFGPGRNCAQFPEHIRKGFSCVLLLES